MALPSIYLPVVKAATGAGPYSININAQLYCKALWQKMAIL